MKKTIILILALILLFIPLSYSIPELPCEYWGSVNINGQSATGKVTAEINGKTYSSDLDNGYYRIKIDAYDSETSEGGREGDKIILKFDDETKEVEWKQGSFREDFNLIEEENQNQAENNKDSGYIGSSGSSSSSKSSSSSSSRRSSSSNSITEVYVRSESKTAQDKNMQESSFAVNYPSKPVSTTNKKSFFDSQEFIILLSLIITMLLAGIIVLFYIILK